MATFSITKQPQERELAYGPIVVTTYNSDTDGYTHAIKIYDIDDNVVAFMTQQPNPSGYTHFKIDSVLQKQLSSDEGLLSAANLWRYSRGEHFEYYIGWGLIENNGSYYESGSTDYKRVWNGRKEYYDIDWDGGKKVPSVTDFGGIANLVVGQGEMLTDRTTYVKGSSIADGKPSHIGSSDNVFIVEKTFETNWSLSLLNQWSGTPLSSYNGCNGYEVYVYSGSTLLNDYDIPNLQTYGGGPNLLGNSKTIPTGSNGQYSFLTMDAGYQYIGIRENPTATHYYICPYAYTEVDTLPTYIYPYTATRFNYVCKDGLDYDTFLLSWVNSYGARDYFEFTKRNEYSVDISRNTYNKENTTWNSDTFEINQYNRGEKVFNTNVTENYLVTTKYLTDTEAQYLKSLFLSNEVYCKFESGWEPIILTSNTYTERNHKKDRFFQYEITFRLANKNLIQQQ